MIKDLALGGLAEKTLRQSLFPHAIIDLRFLPIKNEQTPAENPYLRYTNFTYYVRFAPKPHKGKGKPFLIVSDILKSGKIRFKNWDWIIAFAKKQEDLAWLLENTTLCKELLDIAHQNIDMNIPFYFDIIKYDNKLREKVKEETGEWPTCSMFRTPEQNRIEKVRYAAYLESMKKGASEEL